MSAYFQVYKDKAGEYRWRLKAPNHKIIAVSGEGYVTKSGCNEGINDVKRYTPTARVNDLT